MGRGKVQLKRIENKISRQVTFSKRRTGLLKKANEISVLCEAEVAVIIFSAKGKLFEYSTDTSMEAILDKYERHCYADDAELSNAEPHRNWATEVGKLTTKFENLEKNIRNYNGEDLNPLNLKELQQLEHQLDVSLKRLRLRKNQMMLESIAELQKKDKFLNEKNKELEKKMQNPMTLGEEEQFNVPVSTQDALHISTRRNNYEEGGNEIMRTMPHWMLHHCRE